MRFYFPRWRMTMRLPCILAIPYFAIIGGVYLVVLAVLIPYWGVVAGVKIGQAIERGRRHRLADRRAQQSVQRAAETAAAVSAAAVEPRSCAHCGAPNQPAKRPCAYCGSTERRIPREGLR